MLAPKLNHWLAFAVCCLVAVCTSAQPPQSLTLPSVDIDQFLPVHTVSMRPGPFEPQQRRTGVSRPFFLIGCDAYSLDWLAANRDRLIALGAFGLVVEAPSVQAYRRLEAAAEGLLLRPVSGDLIAEHLGLKTYPAVVTSDGISP